MNNIPININGSVITSEAIEVIKSLQENDNELLSSQEGILGDAICAILICGHGPDDIASVKIATELAYLRDSIKSFAKP